MKKLADKELIDWPKYLMEGEYRPNIHLHIDRDMVIAVDRTNFILF